MKALSKTSLLATLKEANDVFRFCSKKLKILAAISWGATSADEFFKKKAAVMPTPAYHIDVDGLSALVDSLVELAPKLRGEHPVYQWLTRTQESYVLGAKLLLEIGTKHFYEVSSELYGNSRSQLFNGKVTNLDLANSISNRISVCNVNDVAESIVLKSSETFSADLAKWLRVRKPQLPVKIVFTDDIAAKVVAGMSRVRVRRDARFSQLEVSALWNHEIETHALTAHNGSLQNNCDFLFSAGPRTTMTQEGLAVFSEIYNHSMSQRRFLAICDRVHAVEMVEKGADFMELYRWYRERSDNDREAFFSASRIFRGAKLEGSYPFTKDVVYIGGLLGIYSFLQVAVKNQNRLLVESLFCGRMALEDVGTIAWLRQHGILNPPHFIPQWLRNWEALLSFFSFTGFLSSVDMSSFQAYVESHFTLQDWDLGV